MSLISADHDTTFKFMFIRLFLKKKMTNMSISIVTSVIWGEFYLGGF